MEVHAWKRITGDTAAAMTKRAEAQTAGIYQRLERELGSNPYFNGADFGWGDLSVFPYVNGSVVWGFGPKPGSKLAAWLERVNHRDSIKKTVAATGEFQGNLDALPQMLASGQFKRQYRDHRLEWMIRSGGIEVVIEGMKNGTLRFSERDFLNQIFFPRGSGRGRNYSLLVRSEPERIAVRYLILPHDGVAKCVPNTMTLLSAYFSQNARRVFFAIAPSLSKPSSHSGYAHCTG